MRNHTSSAVCRRVGANVASSNSGSCQNAPQEAVGRSLPAEAHPSPILLAPPPAMLWGGPRACGAHREHCPISCPSALPFLAFSQTPCPPHKLLLTRRVAQPRLFLDPGENLIPSPPTHAATSPSTRVLREFLLPAVEAALPGVWQHGPEPPHKSSRC